VVEGATESAATVQALLDSLVGRGLDLSICRLFIVDGAKALTKAIRRTFGSHTPHSTLPGAQGAQHHRAFAKAMQASVRRTLRQARELDDAAKAEKLIRNLAHRVEHDAPGVRHSILEGLDETFAVNRPGLPAELHRSLACTNIIENMNGTVRRVCRDVKHRRNTAMDLRWTGAAMLEATKGFRRLKAHRQLPVLRAALADYGARHPVTPALDLPSTAITPCRPWAKRSMKRTKQASNGLGSSWRNTRLKVSWLGISCFRRRN
jgi:transposase-like protein